MADTTPQFIRLGLRKRDCSTRLRMRWDRSPETCATVARILPVEDQVYHAKFANNEIYNLVPLPKPAPPQEWACVYPGPGDLLFAPVSSRLTGGFAGGNTLSEQKLVVDEDGWLLDFAFFYERGKQPDEPLRDRSKHAVRDGHLVRGARGPSPRRAATFGSPERWARACTSNPPESKLLRTRREAFSRSIQGCRRNRRAASGWGSSFRAFAPPVKRRSAIPRPGTTSIGCAGFGFPHIRTVDAHTEANGRHDVESVFDTGREDKLVAAARELAGAGCAAVAWPCTCGSFIGGLAWSRSQADAMARVTALPVTSTSLAMLEAVTALGADTVDVVSAYPAPTTHRFLRFLDDAGIGVAAMVSLDCKDELLSHALNIRREVAQFTRSLSPRTHPLLIPDTAINAIALIADLEEDIGRPVVAGNQATFVAQPENCSATIAE